MRPRTVPDVHSLSGRLGLKTVPPFPVYDDHFFRKKKLQLVLNELDSCKDDCQGSGQYPRPPEDPAVFSLAPTPS